MGPGARSITIRMLSSPFGGGAAYFRVDPKRDHFVCYRIVEEGRFQRREVTTQDQFGNAKLLVLRAELLCVPASKTDVQPPK